MKLKTKIISAICAGALALSMPAMAFATASSPDIDPDGDSAKEEISDAGAATEYQITNAKNWTFKNIHGITQEVAVEKFKNAGVTVNNYVAGINIDFATKPNAPKPVTITLTLKAGELADGSYDVVTLHDGEYKTLTATVTDDVATFETKDFSEFILTNNVAGTPLDPIVDPDAPAADGENTENGMPATGIAA